MTNLAIDDMSAGLGDLEPFGQAQRLGGLGERVVDRVLDAAGGRADQLDLLVGVMIRHVSLLCDGASAPVRSSLGGLFRQAQPAPRSTRTGRWRGGIGLQTPEPREHAVATQ